MLLKAYIFQKFNENKLLNRQLPKSKALTALTSVAINKITLYDISVMT